MLAQQFLTLLLSLLALAEPTPEPSVQPNTSVSPSLVTSSPSTTTSDLLEEQQDQVAIVKHINRVNEDGSYTFGYEAADGSFKIETRDVAGNVKGMFGFVDEGGHLKRVSYTANNGTGYHTDSPVVPSLIKSAEVESTTRISLLPHVSSDRLELSRPVYIYKTTTTAPHPEIIQHIPKLRPTPATESTEPTDSGEVTGSDEGRPAYGTVLPKKSPTPNYITLSSTSAPNFEEASGRSSVVQLIRPRGYKKLFIGRRPVEASTTTTVSSTTEYYKQDSEEMMETSDAQRQVNSNTLGENGPVTSGTEDRPDVFGGDPTLRPYTGGAYQTLFSPLPQFQRILHQSSQPPSGPGFDPRLAQAGVPGNSPNGYPYQGAPLNQFPNGLRQFPPGPLKDQRFLEDPRNAQNLPDPAIPIPGTQGQILSLPNRPGGSLPPNIRGYQGLVFPSGGGRPRILPPPGAPGPLDYSQNPNSRALPIPANGPSADDEAALRRPSIMRPPQVLPPPSYNPSQGLGPVESEEIQRPAPIPPREPNPYSNANPQSYLLEYLIRMLLAAQARGLIPPQVLPGRNYDPQRIGGFEPPPGPPYMANGQYDPRFRFPQQFSPLGGFDPRVPNNIPVDYLGNQEPRSPSSIPPQYFPYQNYYPQSPQQTPYDPRYSQPPIDPRYPYSPPPPPFDLRYSSQHGPIDTRYPFPYSTPYSPLPSPPYPSFNQYSPYTANTPYNPEVLLRMLLGTRYPGPIPEPNSQIQSSPSGFDEPAGRSSEFNSQFSSSSRKNFEQRPSPEGGIVQRSPSSREELENLSQKGDSSVTSTTPSPPEGRTTSSRLSHIQRLFPSQRNRNKGNRNVQIIEDTTASESTTRGGA